MKQLNWYQIFGVQIPDGRTVLPTDDIQIWLHCANIWDKNYTTLAEVLADSTTLSALISDNNATDYLVRSTTWASGMCADSTAMTYIGLNNYCANTLLADSTWRTAICNSTYFESVLNVKVPTMTSDTTPSGVCFGSTYYQAQYDYYKVFDNDNSTRWASAEGDTTGSYVGYQFTSPLRVIKVAIKTTATATGKIQGSNDGLTYNDIASINIATAETIMSFDFANSNDYSYYRFYNTTAGYVSPYTLQFYGREDV